MQNAQNTHSVDRESALNSNRADQAVCETLRQLCGVVGQDMTPVFLATLTSDLSNAGRVLSDAAGRGAMAPLRDACHTLAALAATVGDAGLAASMQALNDAAHRGDRSGLPHLCADIDQRLTRLLDLVSGISDRAKKL